MALAVITINDDGNGSASIRCEMSEQPIDGQLSLAQYLALKALSVIQDQKQDK